MKKQIRIILSGASSAGKTTLANDFLKKHGSFVHIDELAREIMKEQKIDNEDLRRSLQSDKQLFLDFQRKILDAQIRKEQECDTQRDNQTGDQSVGRSYISDRGLDPIAYAGAYGTDDEQERMMLHPAAMQLIERYQTVNSSRVFTLIVLVHPLDHVDADGVRLVQELKQQLEYTQRLRNIFRANRIPFMELECSGRNERVAALEEALHQN